MEQILYKTTDCLSLRLGLKTGIAVMLRRLSNAYKTCQCQQTTTLLVCCSVNSISVAVFRLGRMQQI